MIVATFWSIVDTFGTLKAFLGLLWIIFGSMAIAIQLNHVFLYGSRKTDGHKSHHNTGYFSQNALKSLP